MNDFSYDMVRTMRRWRDAEGSAVWGLQIGDEYLDALVLLREAQTVIMIGMGKCGHVAKKVVATFTSVGVSAKFMHPVEALHGDLGMVGKDDIFIIFSNSGETDEIVSLLPLLYGKIIAVTGSVDSRLAHGADVVLDIGVCSEIDDYGIVPTTSTTCMVVVGDVLAVALMKVNGFNDKDFVANHAGGSIGKRLK